MELQLLLVTMHLKNNGVILNCMNTHCTCSLCPNVTKSHNIPMAKTRLR